MKGKYIYVNVKNHSNSLKLHFYTGTMQILLKGQQKCFPSVNNYNILGQSSLKSSLNNVGKLSFVPARPRGLLRGRCLFSVWGLSRFLRRLSVCESVWSEGKTPEGPGWALLAVSGKEQARWELKLDIYLLPFPTHSNPLLVGSVVLQNMVFQELSTNKGNRKDVQHVLFINSHM